jgi:purine-binding chemotaxis protein CheW
MTSSKRIQLLTFTLAREIYALDVSTTREVIEFSHVTPIPKTPPWIRGILNLRGSVLPVLDLKQKLGMGATERSRDVCVLILDLEIDGESTLVGVLADAVREVIEVESSAVEPPPKFGSRLSTEYIRGVCRRNDDLIIVLDVAKIFAASELELAQQEADAAEQSAEPTVPVPLSSAESKAEATTSAETPTRDADSLLVR